MLQNKPEGSGRMLTIGILVGVEFEEGEISSEDIVRRLADTITWMEGVAGCEIEDLGKISLSEDEEVIPEPEGTV